MESKVVISRKISSDKNLQKKISDLGYEVSDKGFSALIQDKLKNQTLLKLARDLEVQVMYLRGFMKRYGITNPNKPGGNRNPWGRYGKSGKSRCVEKGIITKG